MDTPIEHQDTVRDMFYILFKHKRKIITLFFSIVLTATIGSLLMSPTYEASSKILLKFGRENVYMPINPAGGNNAQVLLDPSREEQRINSEVELIQGRNILEQVIRDVGPATIYPDIDKKPWIALGASPKRTAANRALLKFEKMLTVQAVKKSNIIDIRFQNEDPVVAAQVVNKLVEVFLDHHLKVYQESGEFNFYSNQVNMLEKKLKDSEGELNQFKSTNNIFELQEQKKVLLNQISLLEIDLAKTQGELNENVGKIKALNAPSATASDAAGMGQETDFNPYAISTLRNRLAELKQQEEKLLTNYNEQSIAVVNIRKEIAKAKQLLDREEKIYHDKAVASITQNLSSFKAKEISQQQHLEKFRAELNKINSAEMRLAELERQKKLHEDNYQLYIKKMEEARISNAMDSQKIANISVVGPALPPIKPIKPKVLLYIVLSIFVGAFASIGLALSLEYFSHTFNKPENVEQRASLKVLAVIPKRKLATTGMPDECVEEYRRMKQTIADLQSDRKIKTLLFCCSTRGEGNTTVLINFARTVAAEGDKVLVVDANLRSPSIHDALHLEQKIGFTDLLLDKAAVADAVKKTQIPNLSAITCGTHSSNPLSFLDSRRLPLIIDQLKSLADWVLFDATPVIAYNDARVLGIQVDSIIMVIEAEKTRWEVVNNARERMENGTVKILGAVLNKRQMHIPGWAYNKL
jgi:capsular exopolysaccharide synthesis family protein